MRPFLNWSTIPNVSSSESSDINSRLQPGYQCSSGDESSLSARDSPCSCRWVRLAALALLFGNDLACSCLSPAGRRDADAPATRSPEARFGRCCCGSGSRTCLLLVAEVGLGRSREAIMRGCPIVRGEVMCIMGGADVMSPAAGLGGIGRPKGLAAEEFLLAAEEFLAEVRAAEEASSAKEDPRALAWLGVRAYSSRDRSPRSARGLSCQPAYTNAISKRYAR